MSQKILISVVTISFNQAKYLERCINSVFNQTYKNYEHIITDPGSTDGSIEIIKKNNKKFKKIIFKKDKGPADGLNNCFKYAKGDIYFFLNSDDEIPHDAFEKAVKVFEENDIDILLGSGYIIDEKNKKLKFIIPTKFTQNEYLYNNAVIFQQGLFFKSTIYKQIKGFNLNSICSWDGELLFEMMNKTSKIYLSYDVYGYFRVYINSISGSGKFNISAEKDRLRLFKKNKNRNYNKLDRILEKIYYPIKFFSAPLRTFLLIFRKIFI